MDCPLEEPLDVVLPLLPLDGSVAEDPLDVLPLDGMADEPLVVLPLDGSVLDEPLDVLPLDGMVDEPPDVLPLDGSVVDEPLDAAPLVDSPCPAAELPDVLSPLVDVCICDCFLAWATVRSRVALACF